MKKNVVAYFMFVIIFQAVATFSVAAEEDYLPYLDEKYGKILLNMRWRFENVNQDGLDDASALTLRTRLGYQTPKWSGFIGLVELEHTVPFNSGTYRSPGQSTSSSNADRAVIADPRNTELNRFQVSYTGLTHSTMTLGRQRIKLNNDRFVGNVGWRQNEQTFDAFALKNQSIKALELYYGYLDRVNRIFGKDASPSEGLYYWDMEGHLLNVVYTPCSYAKLAAYAYLLEIESNQAASNDSYGIYMTGGYPIGDLNLNYRGEYATQNDNDESPSGTSFDLDYYHLKIGAKCDSAKLDAGAGYEVLEGNGARGFTTPLATLHAFQGWADKFLSTPPNGIEDLYFWAGVDLPHDVTLKAVYHIFEAENNGMDYGDEIDLLAVWKIDKHFKLLTKYAKYNADDLFTDTDKFIVEINFTY